MAILRELSFRPQLYTFCSNTPAASFPSRVVFTKFGGQTVVTSEELEVSLRTEFENYLNDTLAAVRRDVSEFQKNFETEFAKHKSQMDEALRVLSSRFESAPALDKGFAESVVEHLRLARDDGAQITAAAFGEAEKLKGETEAAPARYDQIRDAIIDISSQTSQAAILKSLVDNAVNFAARGAFFIVKHDQFVGWKSFGEGSPENDERLLSVQVPMAADTLLARAANSLSTKEGAFGQLADDNLFLEPVGFGRPDRMYAIPLIARGRGVAVLYADFGTAGVSVNHDALETLVRVAGITVELRAAAQHPVVQPEPQKPTAEPEAARVEEAPATYQAPAYTMPEAAVSAEQPDIPEAEHFSEAEQQFEAPQYETASEIPSVEYSAPETTGFDIAEPESADTYGEVAEPVAAEVSDQIEPAVSDQYIGDVVYEDAQVSNVGSVEAEAPSSHGFEIERTADSAFDPYVEPQPNFEQVRTEASAEPIETVAEIRQEADFVPAPEPVFEAPAVAEEPAPAVNGYSTQPIGESAVQTAGRSRFSERTIDLPIDVPEEERKLHNNARRFARLLVSEIKLYNEQKVIEGREAGDLYDRLREAIDRSREMYEKRVEPQVSMKFDYFHYELLNDLAAGEPAKLGSSYPGAVV